MRRMTTIATLLAALAASAAAQTAPDDALYGGALGDVLPESAFFFAPNASPYDESCFDFSLRSPERELAADYWDAEEEARELERCAAQARFDAGEYAEAAAAFEKLAETARDDHERVALWTQAAAARRALDDNEAAAALLARALDLRPHDANLRVERAVDLARLGRYPDALVDLDVAAARDPLRTDALLYRAGVLRLLGEGEKALASIEAALAIAPEDPALLFERGNVRETVGDFDGAAADWRAVVQLDPESSIGQDAEENLARLELEPPAAP